MRRFIPLGLLALPLPAKAASFREFTDSIVNLVNTAVMPLLYTLAFLMFMIGMVRYFFIGGDEGRQKGRVFMLWGLIGLVVLFSVWGIVRLFLTLLPGTGA